MLSKILVSALLVLQTGFVVASPNLGDVGRKVSLSNAHRLLIRQATCPAGSFECADGTGCCDVGTTCGYRASDNFPICKGGTCNGGPICQSGLCCDLGFVCDEVSQLCAKDTGSGGGLTPSSIALSSIRNSSTRPSSVQTTAIPTPTEISSNDFFSDIPVSTSSARQTTPISTPSPTGFNFSFPPTGTPTPIAAPTRINGVPAGVSNAADGTVNVCMKVAAGAVAGVLAFVL